MGAWLQRHEPASGSRALRRRSGEHVSLLPDQAGSRAGSLNHNCQVQLDSWKAVLQDLEDPLEILIAYLTLPRDPLKGCRVGRMAQDKAVVADDGLRQPVAEAFARLREMLAAVIRMARSQGRLPADLEPDHLARTMVAVVQGGYVLAMAEQDRAPYDAACQGALELLRVAAGTAGTAPGSDGSTSS